MMPKITKEEMIDALGRSGYFLESRVLSNLHHRKYVNAPNSSYPDGITGKSRELDIYSEGERETHNLELNHYLHFEFQHRLIIECSNNPQPAVFLKRPDKAPYTIYGKFKYNKLERKLENGDGSGADFFFHEYTTESKDFHYNKFLTNTQYCSFSEKKGKEKEWMANHPDGLHDTFNKLFDCTKFTQERYFEWMPKSAWRDEVFVLMLYPIIIIQNDLYEATEKDGKIEVEEKKHVVYEFNRYTDHSETILIDVITEDYLDTFLNIISNDMVRLKENYVLYYSDKRITAANKKNIASGE
jgi:hypothetical protein